MSTEIQLIRNATLKINYAGKTLLVDPMLCPKESFMSFVVPDQNLNPTVDLPLSIEEVTNGVDAVLLTHSHPDHFDPVAMEVLPKGLPFFFQPADEEVVAKAGFTNASAVADSAEFEGISITRTTGVHGPAAALEMLGTVSGFVLKAENQPTVYIVGDCIWDADIERQLEEIKPDIIVTNSGGAIFMGETKILMDEAETLKVAQKVPNAKLVAVHMESLDHCKTTRPALKAAAEQAGISLLIPADGETVSF